MDPSNNNSFGSFGAGSNPAASNGAISSGATGSGVPSSGAPGAIVSSGDTAVDDRGFATAEFPRGGLTLNGDNAGRSRKGLIIGLVVAFVLLIGGGVAALVVNGTFGGGSGSDESSSDGVEYDVVIDESVSTEIAFNRYVNYLVSGKIGDEANAVLSTSEEVELETKYNDAKYLNNLLALYNSFYTKFKDGESGNYENLAYDAYQIKNGLEYLLDLDKINFLDKNNLEEIYLRDGVENALKYLQGLNTESDNDSYLIVEMKKNQVKYGEALIEYWNVCAAEGCVVNGELVSECERGVEWSKKRESVMKYNATEELNDEQIFGTIDTIKKYTDNIAKSFAGGSNE